MLSSVESLELALMLVHYSFEAPLRIGPAARVGVIHVSLAHSTGWVLNGRDNVTVRVAGKSLARSAGCVLNGKHEVSVRVPYTFGTKGAERVR